MTQNTCCCSAERPRICRWIWCQINDATLEHPWTEPKTCERWNPYKNADDGNQPSLCAAIRKANVSTKVGQSSVHWSRHIASTATASCPRYCFMVTLRFTDTASTALSFAIDLFSTNTHLQQFFLNRGVQCARFDPFSDDYTIFRREFNIFCASWQEVGPSPPVSSLSVGRNHQPLRSATRTWRLPAQKISDTCQVTKALVCEWSV